MTVSDPTKHQALSQEISTLLEKGAIEGVALQTQQGGFYSVYFLIPKKRGWVLPYTGLTRAEQISESVVLPLAKYSRCAPSHDTAELVHNHRFKGRIFSCSNSTTSQTVPALHIGRAGLSVQGAPSWSIPSPTGLHEVHAGSAGPDASHRNANPPIFGR